MDEYAGEYISEELFNAQYRVVVENGNFIVTKGNIKSNRSFVAMAKDTFVRGETFIEFVRQGEKITGARLNTRRCVGIEFVKK